MLQEVLEIKKERRPKIGIVLGTGWGDAITWKDERRTSLTRLPWFKEIGQLEGHAREVVYGHMEGADVIALRGRIHLNEAPPTHADLFTWVRLQVEMLFNLGVETIILTAAAGSLKASVMIGDMVTVDGFVTLFSPDMPLYAGEFCSPEDTLDPHLQTLSRKIVLSVTGKAPTGGHAILRGPFFEGRKYDKPLLMASGASTVGMSIVPEACIAALYGVRVLALTFITNDAVEIHSHEVNQARAREKSADMGAVLHALIRELSAVR